MGELLEPAVEMQKSNQLTTQIFADKPDWEMISDSELEGARWLTQTYSFLIFAWLSNNQEKVELVARVNTGQHLTPTTDLNIYRVNMNGWNPKRDFDKRPVCCLLSDIGPNFRKDNKQFLHKYKSFTQAIRGN